MLDAITVLTYLVTHNHKHSDRLRLSVKKDHGSIILRWDKVPPEAHSLAFLVKDAQGKNPRYHAVFYNIPAVSGAMCVSNSLKINYNDTGLTSWGDHKFHAFSSPVKVSLYALDTKIAADTKLTGEKLKKHIKGHLVAKATKTLS